MAHFGSDKSVYQVQWNRVPAAGLAQRGTDLGCMSWEDLGCAESRCFSFSARHPGAGRQKHILPLSRALAQAEWDFAKRNGLS